MIYVGIDVAKDKHDCFITNSDGEVLFKSFTISNNREGFETLFQRIVSVSDDLTKVKVGLEATGHYSYNLLGFLLDKGCPTFVINPLHTNLYRKSLSLRKTKTDKVDAFFKCENCGLYTVSDDKRSRLCNRLHYDGNQYDSLEYKCVEYYYTCRQETYIKRNKTYDTVIERITENERSRLYKVIEGSGMLKEISYKLLDKLKETVDDNEQKYIKKMKDALNNKEDEQSRLQIANEYLGILIREVDKAIKENIGSQTGLTFKRRNNPKITSLEGNLFG